MNSIALPSLKTILSFLGRFAAVFCVALIWLASAPSCKTLEGMLTHPPSTTDVTTATAMVVTATRDFVLVTPGIGGPAALTTLNEFILVIHNGAAALAADVQKGSSAMPTPLDVQNYLLSQAAKFGSPVWMKNFIGNLVTEYGRFYATISKDSPTAYAYLNAFALGTI